MNSFRVVCVGVLLCLAAKSFSQDTGIKRPKLVVGITVDQMRQEYLYRYYAKYGQGGFKRLMEGFMVENGHYNYVPTVTGPGHASIFTGATPSVHGIIGNSWYDKTIEKYVYCAGDETRSTVGSATVAAGRMSPHRMLTSTISDELKLFTQNQSKVIGMSVKDRGAILPAGHMANAAYWYDGQTGSFITSTYYMDKLPAWLDTFNKLQLADKYLSGTWNTLLPIAQYTESGSDNSPYEARIPGDNKSTFPYNLKELRKTSGNFELLSLTPFSNDYLTELAKAAIDGEKLGADHWTDMLCISYSSPDIIGHQVGPNAVELQDTYMRLDKNIEDLLKKLDQAVGQGNYLVFLSSDHAVADVPQFMTDNKVPSGYISTSNLGSRLVEFLSGYFPDRKVIKTITGEQIYLNHEAFSADPKTGGVDYLLATELITNFLMQQEGIANVYSRSLLRQGDFDEGGWKGMAIRGYHPKRSGDMLIVYEPGWLEGGRVQGTTHGSPYTYDTHVPILFYGFGIRKGSTVKRYSITDIAPTVSMLLKIKLPNGCTGQPIEEVFLK